MADDGTSLGVGVGASVGSAGGGATGMSVEVAVGSTTVVRVGLGVTVLLRVGGSTPEDGVEVGVRVPPELPVDKLGRTKVVPIKMAIPIAIKTNTIAQACMTWAVAVSRSSVNRASLRSRCAAKARTAYGIMPMMHKA
jgi:hypothetical protein